jgi:phage tail sheath gpL-like
MSTITFQVNSSKSIAQSDFQASGQKQKCLANASNLLKGLASGTVDGSVDVHYSATDGVAASGTITLVSCATDTVTIGGITFTGSGSPTGDLQFETDGDDTADAAALCAKINAHPTLSKVVVATSAVNVVTVTCVVKGVVGNFITLAETGTTITISAGALAGGTGGSSGSPVSF